MNNDYLIPAAVIDLCESLLSDRTRENERANYERRITAIRAYCDTVLIKAERRREHNNKAKTSR